MVFENVSKHLRLLFTHRSIVFLPMRCMKKSHSDTEYSSSQWVAGIQRQRCTEKVRVTSRGTEWDLGRLGCKCLLGWDQCKAIPEEKN